MHPMDEGDTFQSLLPENEEPPVRPAAVEASVRTTASRESGRRVEFARVVDDPPPLTEEPQPHPRRPPSLQAQAQDSSNSHATLPYISEQENQFITEQDDRRSAAREQNVADQLPVITPLGQSYVESSRNASKVLSSLKGALKRGGTAAGLSRPPVESDTALSFVRSMTSNSDFSRTIRKLHHFTESHVFDAFFCGFIFLSAIFVSIEVQMTGLAQGAVLSVYMTSPPSWDYHPFFSASQWVFGVIFTVELLLKLAGSRLKFFCKLWNWLDAAIVALTLLSLAATETLPLDPKPLRMVRLARLLRMMRFFRSFPAFDSLYLMVAAIKRSFHILGWTCILGFIVQMFWALLVTELLYGFYFCEVANTETTSNARLVCEELPESELARQKEVYVYYGTFVRSMFTMFEVTLANWPPAARVLSENVHWSFMPIFVMHKFLFGFALVAVVTGVIMKETFKVAELDDQLMVWQKERQVQAHTAKMKALFAKADTSHDGRITLQEFRNIMRHEDVRTWLSSMDMNAGDVDQLFAMIDMSGDGAITVEELIQGVSNLKGAARSLDLLRFMDEHNRFVEQVKMYFDNSVERQVATIEGDVVEARRGKEWASAVVIQARNQMVRLKWAGDGAEDQIPVADVRVRREPPGA